MCNSIDERLVRVVVTDSSGQILQEDTGPRIEVAQSVGEEVAATLQFGGTDRITIEVSDAEPSRLSGANGA